jgi:putative DNA primase/helicase
VDDVLSQLAAAGLEIAKPLEFARLVRCRADGDKGGKESGWYVLHEMRLDSGDTVIVGRYGNWKRFGGESLSIEFDKPALSAAERQRLETQQQQLREQASQEKQERAAEAASRAHQIWEKLPDSGKSDYLNRKKVGAFGVRFSRGSIVIPVRNAEGLVGLQFIAADGSKKFLTGTAKNGAWHLIGAVSADYLGTLWIAEGYATAATVHMAMYAPVVVAFDAGNLLPAAKEMRRLYPGVRIAFAADDDALTQGNPGLTKAREAARQVSGLVVAPRFGEAAA